MTGWRCCGLAGPATLLTREEVDEDEDTDPDAAAAADDFLMKCESLLTFKGGGHKALLVTSFFAWNCVGLMVWKNTSRLMTLKQYKIASTSRLEIIWN